MSASPRTLVFGALLAASALATPAHADPAMPQELTDALAGKYKGTVVTAFGAFADADEVKFNQNIKAFEEQTGIDIQYASSKQFEATIATRVDAGNTPDLVDFPQPGLMGNFSKTGKLVDLASVLGADYLKAQYQPSWLDMGTKPGPDGKPTLVGIWERVNVKSLVWYPKKPFEEAGYKVPTNWDEMVALEKQIIDDGDTPWCIGIESGAATGWPATDWLEEMMLRTASVADYDAWTSGELKFSSPQVKKAAEQVGAIFVGKGMVYGGTKAIVSTSFGDAPSPMFADPPKCWLHKQGNFITTFFPEGLEPGVDYSFFYLPSVDTAYGKPVLVAGDIYAAFDDRPEVKAVMEYFATGDSVKAWVQSGGAISPHLDSSLDWYTNVVDRGVAEIILNATSVRFDGSDLMPGAVGAGSFWKSMTSYVSGSIDLDTALKEIDASWPK